MHVSWIADLLKYHQTVTKETNPLQANNLITSILQTLKPLEEM